MNIKKLITKLQYGQRGLTALSALCITAALPVLAALPTLKVQLKNSAVQCFMLADRPVVTFSDTHCIIKSESLSAEYPLADVDHAVITEDMSGVGELEHRVVVDFSNPLKVVVRGVMPGAQLRVTGMDGGIVATVVADTEGNAGIELGSIPAGVYVVTSKEITFKVYRK